MLQFAFEVYYYYTANFVTQAKYGNKFFHSPIKITIQLPSSEWQKEINSNKFNIHINFIISNKVSKWMFWRNLAHQTAPTHAPTSDMPLFTQRSTQTCPTVYFDAHFYPKIGRLIFTQSRPKKVHCMFLILNSKCLNYKSERKVVVYFWAKKNVMPIFATYKYK